MTIDRFVPAAEADADAIARLVNAAYRPGPDAETWTHESALIDGEGPGNDCVMRGYHRLAWQEEGPVAGVILRFHLAPPAAAWQYEILRLEQTSSEVAQQE